MPDGMSSAMSGGIPDPQAQAGGMPGQTPMAPPAGTPDSEGTEKSGEAEQAKANVQIAISILEQTLSQLGSDSEEGSAVLKALTTLSKSFAGKKSQDLAPAELMQLMSGMPDQYKQQMGAEMGAKAGAPPQGMPPGM